MSEIRLYIAKPRILSMVLWLYLLGALLIGLGMSWATLDFARYHRVVDAHRFLRAFVLCLPLQLLLIVLDAT